jgi:hypothetical protein
MKTLACASDAEELRRRFAALTAADSARWGLMSVAEMVCHVREAYRYPLRPGDAAPLSGPIPPAVMKRLALRLPMKWPKNVATIPELKAGSSTLQPVGFAADREGLLRIFTEFCAVPGCSKNHPIFGSMRHGDWMRWGYLHGDHHLRQFGR